MRDRATRKLSKNIPVEAIRMGWRRSRMRRTAHTHLALGRVEDRGRNQHRQEKATVCAASRLKIQSGVDLGDTRSHTHTVTQLVEQPPWLLSTVGTNKTR